MGGMSLNNALHKMKLSMMLYANFFCHEFCRKFFTKKIVTFSLRKIQQTIKKYYCKKEKKEKSKCVEETNQCSGIHLSLCQYA